MSSHQCCGDVGWEITYHSSTAEKDLSFESIDLLASSLVATGDTMVLLVKTCNAIVVS